ncbi:MAG: hypothetical protein ACI87E_003116 [Mariniblastus sp.]|jgi:hypothetical protein
MIRQNIIRFFGRLGSSSVAAISFVLLTLLASVAIGQDGDDDRDSIVASLKLTDDQANAIKFQPDAQKPIFTYGTLGGLRVRPRDDGKIAVAPKLQIFADGKCLITNPQSPTMERKLDQATLISFLNFVVNQHQFYRLDTKEIEQRIAGKEKIKVMDAASSVFVVELQKGRHEVAVYAMWNAVNSFPDYEPLAHLAAIEKRCTTLVSLIHLGDDGPAVLKVVNSALADLKLGLKPFTIEEMRMANRAGNGRFQVAFHRSLPGAKARGIPPTTLHTIYFKKDAATESKVTFYGLPLPIKKK